MAHASAFHGPAARAPAARGLMGFAKQAWAAYWRHRAAVAAAAMLRTLDDRTLKDIGLDRSEIDSVVYAGDGAERRLGMRM